MGKKLKLLIIGMLSLLVPILLAFAISLSLSNNRELGRDTSAAASTTMKLITYNVLGIGLDSRIQEIADYIEKESPDVIALQEMHWEDNQNRLKTALESRGLEYYSVQNAH
ncbi:endonuclease/exonuclease/phosphatase family protein [Candidatus Dojkabacteria bacterium]|uniref:Endonuclease/exonuclease/phosphatase family protein n=1 Tax=Candidatus Dojkabacteria bacterium TaxID=2099670 RepID=A0A955L8J7_9BACT|nr:endonuclease/exonuclease/phosphatase family protein [Candidatus Dojkabacteria bacterium]